jgi:hypothetical protein
MPEPRPVAEAGAHQRRCQPPRTDAAARKLVVAADAPWQGEIYHTRPGRNRLRFSTLEEFCRATLAVTQWSVDATGSDGVDDPFAIGRDTQNARPVRSVSQRGCESVSGKFKFIVAATAPWTGEMYRTRRGLGHYVFDTFEEFVSAVLQITGWPLDCGSLRAGGPATAGR